MLLTSVTRPMDICHFGYLPLPQHISLQFLLTFFAEENKKDYEKKRKINAN